MNEGVNKQLKCTLKPSDIHGVGVFPIRDIKKGEKLYCESLEPKLYQGLDGLRPEVKKLVIQRWAPATKGYQYLIDDVRLISFMNHSDDPNYDKHNDVAFRAIKEGEEVTQDYGEYKDICLSL